MFEDYKPPFSVAKVETLNGDITGYDVQDSEGDVVDFFDDLPDAQAKADELNKEANRV